MNRRLKISLLLPATLMLLLVGCGGGTDAPSVDIEATVEARVKERLAAIPTPTARVVVKEVVVEATAQVAKPVPPSPMTNDISSSTNHAQKGYDHLNQGDYQKAIEQYNEAIRLDPQYAPAYLGRGLAYGVLGQDERAIQDLDEAIRLNPQYTPAYVNRGNAYSNLGEYERAIQDLDEAIRLNPQQGMAYFSRGLVYGSLGEYERAIQDFDEAIRLNPQYAPAYYYRGLAYNAMGKSIEAERDFAKAEELGISAP